MGTSSYFAKEAETYDNKLNTGVLGVIRNAERKAILQAINPETGEKILDIPCGTGYYADYIKATGAEVYGIDISQEMLTVFKKKGYGGEIGNLETFSLNITFDKVLSAGGFEFCKEHKHVVKNLLAHVKKGGILVMLVTRNNLFGRLFWLYHYLLNKTSIAFFSKKEIVEMCTHEDAKIVNVIPCSLFASVIILKKK